MRHAAFALIAIGLSMTATGCRMCAHPYDYCGPTFTGGACDTCDFNARAGSILSPPLQTAAVQQGEVTYQSDLGAEQVAPMQTQEIDSTPPDITMREPVVLPTPRRASVGTRILSR